MYLDPKEYRFKSTLTGKLKLQRFIQEDYLLAGSWEDARATDLMAIPEHEPVKNVLTPEMIELIRESDKEIEAICLKRNM